MESFVDYCYAARLITRRPVNTRLFCEQEMSRFLDYVYNYHEAELEDEANTLGEDR